MKAIHAVLSMAVALILATATGNALADGFGAVRYDPARDQLVIVMVYRGTTPDHHFSIQWGPCQRLDQPGEPAHQIALNVLDDQGNDAAKANYTKTVKVPLANLACRPAKVSVWTPPRHFRSLDIPVQPR